MVARISYALSPSARWGRLVQTAKSAESRDRIGLLAFPLPRRLDPLTIKSLWLLSLSM